MQHSFDGACVMASFDEFEGDALVDPEGGSVGVEAKSSELELGLEFVDGEVVDFLKLLVDFFLHFLVFEEGYERVSVLSRVFFLLFLLFLIILQS